MSIDNNNEHDTQEQELWERIGSTEGIERAEALDELGRIAYRRDDYKECLHLLDTSIEIYFKFGMDNYTTELIHLYEGKAFSLRNLNRLAESAETFDDVAKFQLLKENTEGYIRAKRAAACDWYEVKQWQKCLDGHSAALDALDPEATPVSMGIDQHNVAMAQAKLGLHKEAVENYLGARKLFKEGKSPEFTSGTDHFLSISYAALNNGPESMFHAKHFFNYSKVAEDMTMEGQARLRLGIAHLLCQEYEDAQQQFVLSLEQLTLDDVKDWEMILDANRQLAKALTALGREDEAKVRLERIATIEETICGDEKAA